MRTLKAIVADLVRAHREERWEDARVLSQEKERAKKALNANRRCEICGVRLSKPKPNTNPRWCYMHFQLMRQKVKKL